MSFSILSGDSSLSTLRKSNSCAVAMPSTFGVVFSRFLFLPISIYSYFGQAFVALVPTVPTAQILAAVFIGLNNFFSGLIVRPQYLSSFFEIPYWITPGKLATFNCVCLIVLLWR